MMRYRWIVLVMGIILCAAIWGCSKKEEGKTANVTVALQDKTKELPRLEQNYVYESSLAQEEQEPFYFHESPDPLIPMSEEEKKKSPSHDTV